MRRHRARGISAALSFAAARVALLVLGTPLPATATPSESAEIPRPPVLPLRHEEDWSAFRDPSRRVRHLDRLKYVPLEPGGDVYVTLGGEARAAYELFIDEDYGRVPQDDSGSFLFRGMLHANWRVGPHFRSFVELKSALEAGRDGGPAPLDEDRLDLHQGFLEVGTSDGRDPQQPGLVLRVGRQELRYGKARLIDVRDGPTVRRSFDAALARLAMTSALLDVWIGTEVPGRPGVFDDVSSGNPTLAGLYLRTLPGAFGRWGFDAYYLGVEQGGLVFADGAGAERRHSIGGRWWSASDRWSHDFEATVQFGELRGASPEEDRAIRAWGLAASFEATLAPGELRPALSFGAGVTSGDRDVGDDRLETFRSPFPDLRFSGATTRLGPSNLFGVNVGIGLDPLSRVHVEASVRPFWRTSTDDAIYSAAGFPQRVSSSSARFVGVAGTLLILWFADASLSVFGLAEHFRPGGFVRSAPPSETSWFLTGGVRFAF